MHHSFDVAHAVAFGQTEAVFIYHLSFWIRHNRDNERNLHEGRTWTYNSVEAFAAQFPYLSAGQIRRALNSLITQKVIVTGNFNENPRDRTLWYAFVDEMTFLEVDPHLSKTTNASVGNKKSHLPKTTNAFADSDKSLIRTDVNTDVNPDDPRPAKRGTRLNKDWRLPKGWGLWALSDPDVNAGVQWTEAHVRATAKKFRDYWVAAPGRHGLKLDWLATWRNWCRDAKSAMPKPDGFRSKTKALEAHNTNAVDEAVRRIEARNPRGGAAQ